MQSRKFIYKFYNLEPATCYITDLKHTSTISYHLTYRRMWYMVHILQMYFEDIVYVYMLIRCDVYIHTHIYI